MEGVPEVIQGVRQICAIASVLLGKAASANGELEGQTPITVPSPTSGPNSVGRTADLNMGATTLVGFVSMLGVLAGLRAVWL